MRGGLDGAGSGGGTDEFRRLRCRKGAAYSRGYQANNDLDIAAAMLRHACHRGTGGRAKEEMAADLRRIIGQHRELWLRRNRVGGLADSSRRLEARLEEYVQADYC